MQILALFFQFMVGHALADFVFQHDAMIKGKHRHGEIHKNRGNSFPSWHYWLTAHALVHGGAVYLITGSLALGLIETFLHWLIDFAKCEKWIGFHQDQILHVACKVGYCLFIYLNV